MTEILHHLPKTILPWLLGIWYNFTIYDTTIVVRDLVYEVIQDFFSTVWASGAGPYLL